MGSRDNLPPYLQPFASMFRAVADWWRELFTLSIVSIAWALLTLTVIGWPPATSALLATARASALHEQPSPAVFFVSLRAYLVRSWQLGLLALASLVIILFDLPFYLSLLNQAGIIGAFSALFVLYIVIMWAWTLSYAWVMLVARNDLKLGQMLRNGALISLRYPFHNLISSLLVGVLLLIAYLLPPLVILLVAPIFSLLCLHNFYLLAPALVPEDIEMLRLVT